MFCKIKQGQKFCPCLTLETLPIFYLISISFSAAYPNPFNPVTMISFAVPSEMEVHVAIHDMLGREIVELANGVYSTGNYNLQWDAGNQASGIYFVKMIAGGETNIQKLMLVK